MSYKYLLRVFLCLLLASIRFQSVGRGHWVRINTPAPDYCNGVMLLLSDGSVMMKASHGGIDTLGNLWDRLTPDNNGSYVNGTWSKLDTSKKRRLYCSTQVLRDGRVYVAGGEYGNGGNNGEIYDPVANNWSNAGPLPAGYSIWDGNSEMLPDGRVLQAIVSGGSLATVIYNPVTNTYNAGPTSLGNHDESAWVKLPDNSILYVDIASNHSERYIPALGKWIRDDTLPVSLYDPYGFETGAGFLLPDGRIFFLGATGATAYYTPSGDTSFGRWEAGPVIPDSFGTPDAAAAMMMNGKILCAVSPLPDSAQHFPSPTAFFEFDYTQNLFTRIPAPDGRDTTGGACYVTNMLDLPDGTVLLGNIGHDTFYVYVPDGTPVASGRPVIDSIIRMSCDTYRITGTLFNGISEGAAYGDDWQMATNYPLVKLVKPDNLYGDMVHYARTFNWNRTGVMTGTLPDTATFSLPGDLPEGEYEVQVVANGISSGSRHFSTCISPVALLHPGNAEESFIVYPNPAVGSATVSFQLDLLASYDVSIYDLYGRCMGHISGRSDGMNNIQFDLHSCSPGIYSVILHTGEHVMHRKLVVE